ncbi:MAG: glutamine synthetase III [Clostridia bacterium]|nr:glutamine synthetase III [Clostridia bacterium]
MTNIQEIFGCQVFNETVMQSRLPKDTYRSLIKTIKDGKTLDIDTANVIANAMKDWAIEKGATHFTHWFQPMTDVTAEKHDSFITPVSGGKVMLEFSGKTLVRGEPDASSLPNGGLRSTFEARGYTAWDPTSFAFIKDDTLCIPTAFCSYGGESLDKKTPLLRSMEAVDKQALRVLRLFGETQVTRVTTTVGAEQEYFLIDKEVYNKRPDLKLCNRTLFGCRAAKGQELDDHYFGKIKPRVSAYMKELDEELWKLGILSKTKHNETAPAQHELAPIFTSANVATDHNQLIMEMMKTVADRHGMVCILHEKPFEGINGSGKHNNWAICEDNKINLLNPGDSPSQNTRFLLFITAVIKAVDDYQELLRASVATAGNDRRLGAGEAPPAVISIFLGDELTAIFEALEKGELYKERKPSDLEIGARVLPKLPQDTTDRNRTSPFAFTGNKFEFRMLGSSASIADTNTILNTAIAESLRVFADELENSEDFDTDVLELIKRTIKKHERIIFNGNNYAEEWHKEAKKRGLPALNSTAEALSYVADEKTVKLFTENKVFTESELISRRDVKLNTYSKTLKIEALTMLEMTKRDILPAVIKFKGKVANEINALTAIGTEMDCSVEKSLLLRISKLSMKLGRALKTLEQLTEKSDDFSTSQAEADYYRDKMIPAMDTLRAIVDELETIVAREDWPYPSYTEMLYSVR